VSTNRPTSFSLDRIVRPAVARIPSYHGADGAGKEVTRWVRLDMNESPFPPSEHVRKALADFSNTNRYPDFAATEARTAIANYTGHPIDQIVCGAGLDDVLNTLFQMTIDPGDEVIITDPTFGVYRALVAIYDGKIVNVPLLGDVFALDVDGVLNAITDRTKVIVLCTPNNPTGNVLDPAGVERIAREAPCLVAIDEAYMEFAGVTHQHLVNELENTAVFRTMSKFAGMAGMRVGYGLFPKGMMAAIDKVTPAFHNVATASAVAVTAALEDMPSLQVNLQAMIAERDRVSDELESISGVTVFPSSTNFVLFRLPLAEAAPIAKELADRGVLIRNFANPAYGLADCLRVSIGSREDDDIFLRELRDILVKRG
jgi:histidinol-phosphate aminotransferase